MHHFNLRYACSSGRLLFCTRLLRPVVVVLVTTRCPYALRAYIVAGAFKTSNKIPAPLHPSNFYPILIFSRSSSYFRPIHPPFPLRVH